MCLSCTSSSRRALAVVVFFFALVAATGLVDTFFPAPRPKLLGAEERRDERLRSQARFGDGTSARLLERELRLTSRVRRTVGSYYAFALFYIFREVGGRLVAGRDDWLYLPGRTLMPERDDRAVAERSAAVLAALERRLAVGGTRLVSVPVPRKSVLYGEYLPRGIDAHPRLDEDLAEALRRRGVEAVDLLAAFRRHKEEHPRELLYFQAGSHWTDVAQVIAAEEICRVAGILAPEGERRSRLVARGLRPQEDDHLAFIGLHVPDRVLGLLHLPEVEEIDVEPEDPAGEPPPGGEIAVAGTSFTARRKLPAFLEHFSQRPVANLATPAESPFAGVLRRMTARGVAPPRILILEMPNHNVVGQNPVPLAAEVFAATPPPEDTLLEIRSLGMRPELRRKVEFRGYLRLTGYSRGALIHSGDGVASLRLRGRAEGKDVRLGLWHDDRGLIVPWPEKQREIVLPLIAAAPTGDAAGVFLGGAGAIELESVDVVAMLDETRAVEGRRAPVSGVDGGWRQRLIFPDRPKVPRHGALWIELGARGRFAGGTLRLHVVTRQGPREPLELAPARRRSQLLISLTPYSGERLLAVEIRGEGKPPRQVVKRVRLLPPARAAAATKRRDTRGTAPPP